MLDELLAHDQVIETVRLGSRVGFMALHGGIEEGTAELATAAAEASGASLYTVTIGEGLWWHVPSIQFDPLHSSSLATFLEHVEVAFSLHGYGRRELGDTILLGGSNRQQARALGAELTARTGLAVIHDIDAIPAGLRGTHARNPVNLPRDGGVQIELPPSARNGAIGSAVVEAMAASAGHAAAQTRVTD